MAEVKFDVVKPNLIVSGNNVYFALEQDEFFQVARDVDGIVHRNIGQLKVRDSDLEVMQGARPKLESIEYTSPLENYLDAQEELYRKDSVIEGVTNRSCKLFGLTWLINASTYEKPFEITHCLKAKRDLVNPDETFDRTDEEDLVYRIDREKTLENLRRYFAELNSRMPDNWVGLTIIPASFSQNPNAVCVVYGGPVKAKDNSQIEKNKSELIERLKQVKGPCLSLDTPAIFAQAYRFARDAQGLLNNYGDILTNRDWASHFFRLDP